MNEKERAGRKNKLTVTDDISHMKITEEEYTAIENQVDPELNGEEKAESEKENQ